MEVHCRVRAAEEPVLEPIGFADSQGVAATLQLGTIAVFVCRIRHDEENVDHWFRSKAGDRCRTDVLDSKRAIAERLANPGSLARERRGPLAIVLDDDD